MFYYKLSALQILPNIQEGLRLRSNLINGTIRNVLLSLMVPPNIIKFVGDNRPRGLYEAYALSNFLNPKNQKNGKPDPSRFLFFLFGCREQHIV